MELSRRPENTTPLPSYLTYSMETPAAVGGGNSEITVPGGTPIENAYSAMATPGETEDTPPQTDVSREVGAPEEQREVREQDDDPFSDSWLADESTASDLRQELECVSPKVRKEATALVEKTIAHALKTYGEYIPDDAVQKIEGFADRMIITDKDSFKDLYKVWGGADELPTENTGAAFYNKGGITVVKDTVDYWQHHEHLMSQVVESPGVKDLEHAKKIMGRIGYAEIAAHEPYHQLQDPTLPLVFQENGAYYYQTDTAASLNFGRVISDDHTKIADFYQELINKYGDDVHKLFFGSLDNPNRRDQILAEYTSEKIAEIFPANVVRHRLKPENATPESPAQQ